MKRLALALLLLTACSQQRNPIIGGLHSAGAQVFLDTPEGERGLTVGAKLHAQDHLRATGPAVIEFFEGGTHFLDGESLTVGEASEARILGATLPVRRLTAGGMEKIDGLTRLVAARYFDTQSTPEGARPKQFTNRDYLIAFFSPNGLDSLQQGPLPDGPREPLPPPPQRVRVPHLHAGDLGEGGPILEVHDGFVSAETGDLATAVLRSGHRYALGQTVRLLLPAGASGLLQTTRGNWALRGPLDLRLH